MKNFISHKFSPKSSNSFFEWSRFSFGTDAKRFAVLQCSGGTIWGEKKAYKRNLFFSFSEIWNFPTFWGKLLFERTAVFKCFPVIEARHFRLLAENFQYGPQNRILRLEGKSLRNKLFHGKHYDFFVKLRHQAKTFRPFDDFFQQVPKNPFHASGVTSRGGNCCKKNFLFICFIHWAKKRWLLLRVFLAGFSKHLHSLAFCRKFLETLLENRVS